MPVLLPYPHLYLHRETFDEFSRVGVRGLLNRREANVLRHEKTLLNRTDLVCEGSLWLWCDTEFDADDVPDNAVITVSDPQRIRQLQQAFEGRELFLADGHHRYAAGWDIATIYTRSHWLRSRPSHRLILEKRGLTLPPTCTVGDMDRYLATTPADKWRAIVVGAGLEFRGLEVSRDLPLTDIFCNAVVQPIREIPEAIAAVRSGRAQMALLVAAYTIEQIEWYARRGVLLPPKSTDFYPKLHFAQNESIIPATAHLLGVR